MDGRTLLLKVIYGAMASFGAVLQYAFVVAHPGKMLQHPMDFVGMDVALALTTYCGWQFIHGGRAIQKWRASRKKAD